MKSRFLKILLITCGVFILAACGEKSQEDVIGNVTDVMEKMDGYKAEAEMAMKTGEEAQQFSIEIWHQKDDFYRVELGHANGGKDSQIILKNEDGVFVLTPALEKSFRFQSEWPENGSQPYLYQSLINDIVGDEMANFETTEDHFIFTTQTNYRSNSNLPYQQIYLDKKTYFPTHVQVLNNDHEPTIEVVFTSFVTETNFAADDFALEKNMGTPVETPTFSAATEDASFPVAYPLYTAGAEAVARKEVELDHGKRVILTYDGAKNFTLVQEKNIDIPTLQAPEAVEGEIVNLGFSLGALADQTVKWSLDGVDYTLASDTLTREELIEVAQSVQGRAEK